MARTVDQEHRDELVRRVTADLIANGLAGATLQRLAAAAGTSGRMLVHHFGSRDALVAQAVARAREDELADMRRALPADADFVGRLPDAWRWFTSPGARGSFRLFGEVAAQARLAQPDDDQGVRRGLSEDWLDQFALGFSACGLDAQEARVAATELLAIVRGLVLDLEATGDLERVTQAYGRLVAHWGHGLGAAAPA